MTTTAIAVALTAVGFPLLLSAIGSAVTALAARRPPDTGRPRHYLAGLLHGVQITSVIDGQDELLVTLATQTTHNTWTSGGQLAGVFRITARECSLARVKRWQQEGTALRAYLSPDGAIMLADLAFGGNAPCEPPITITRQTHNRQSPKAIHCHTAHDSATTAEPASPPTGWQLPKRGAAP